MKLTEEVYLVGSGVYGLGITDDYDCHVYLINAGEALALVDTGAGIGLPRILENVVAEGLDPARISHVLLTHCHLDHCGGSWLMRDRFGAKIAVSEAEAPHLSEGNEEAIGLVAARAAGTYPPHFHLTPCPVDLKLRHGDQLPLGQYQVTALVTPGHSLGSTCYLFQGKELRYLFSGDTVFFGGTISLLNCVGSSMEAYRHHMYRLAGLRVDALLPGHLAFCLRGGQKHLDLAIKACEGILVPKSYYAGLAEGL